MRIKYYIQLIRINQWLKNIFIFAPIFFNGSITNIKLLPTVFYCFFSFCFTASAIYIYNDICDKEKDILHKTKRKRPIAAGQISIKNAYILSFLLIVLAYIPLFLLYQQDKFIGLIANAIIFLYFITNIAYSKWLKKYSLIDVFIISFGFILRLLLGSVTTKITLSPWLLLMTFLVTLFLALSKRRDDVLIYQETGNCTRNNIRQYNIAFIDQSITIIASTNIICYILYTLSPEVITRVNCQYLYLTSIFVILGILRYLQLTIVKQKSVHPTLIFLRDAFLQLCIIFWVITFGIIIYF